LQSVAKVIATGQEVFEMWEDRYQTCADRLNRGVMMKNFFIVLVLVACGGEYSYLVKGESKC